jgi:hypothetical protein
MSVIVTVTVDGNPGLLEAHAAGQPEDVQVVRDRAIGHGVIAHRFYGTHGRIMVVDEWPDEQSFRTFVNESSLEIAAVANAAGMSSEPEVVFWRKLDTDDEIGWGA